MVTYLGRCSSGSSNDGFRLILSCFRDGTPPVSFAWTRDLVEKFPKPDRQITMVLHGACLKYGLRKDNPYAQLLKELHLQGVKMVICQFCQFCLNHEGYLDSELLCFVKPIPFSIDYIIEMQTQCGAVVVYDA